MNWLNGVPACATKACKVAQSRNVQQVIDPREFMSTPFTRICISGEMGEKYVLKN